MPDETPVTVSFRGQPRPATPIKFDLTDLRLATYQLEDGSVLSIQAVVVSVVRIHDEWTADGDPVYQVRSQPVLTVSVPPALKRKS